MKRYVAIAVRDIACESCHKIIQKDSKYLLKLYFHNGRVTGQRRNCLDCAKKLGDLNELGQAVSLPFLRRIRHGIR